MELQSDYAKVVIKPNYVPNHKKEKKTMIEQKSEQMNKCNEN